MAIGKSATKSLASGSRARPAQCQPPDLDLRRVEIPPSDTMKNRIRRYAGCAAIAAAAIGCVREPKEPDQAVDRTLADTGYFAVIDTLWEPDGGYTSIDAIAARSDGTIAVADGGSARLFLIEAPGDKGRQIARHGDGPGELRRASAATFLTDGRLLVRDLVLSRLNTYGRDGAYREQVPVPPSELVGQSALRVVDGTHPLTGIVGPPRGPAEQRSMTYETIEGFGLNPQHVSMPYDMAEQCPVVYMPGAPRVRFGYAPLPVFALLSNGGTVVGCAATQRLELRRPDATFKRLDIGSATVQRTAAEREELKAAFVQLMRRESKSWQWQGSDVPELHPAFSRVYAGDDGSIWVRTPRPSVRCETEEKCVWRARHGFTVFDESGGLFGVFDLPPGLVWQIDPVLSRASILAVGEAQDGREVILRLLPGKNH
jgi:hypothetical protein